MLSRRVLALFALTVLVFLVASSAAFAHPKIVAHRGGLTDAPENTLAAVRLALANRADMIWLSVQVTRDGIAVLHRPPLARISDADQLRVPTLSEAFALIPPGIPVILDIKAEPTGPVVSAVAQAVGNADAWNQVLVYSTQRSAITEATKFQGLRVFESRDATRERLLRMLFTGVCTDPPAPGSWTGYEVRRDLSVSEKFALGSGTSNINGVPMWTAATMTCFQSLGAVNTVFFGVNSLADYQLADALHATAVLVDSPRAFAKRAVNGE